MKIIQEQVTFGELKTGDTFRTSDNYSEVFVKIEDCNRADRTTVLNVLRLSDGTLHHLDNEAILVPITCKVIYR